MLWKVFCKNIKLTYAFNIMLSRTHNNKKYHFFRSYISELISKINKGRKLTDENKKLLSILNKNKVNMRNIYNGNVLRLDKNDPLFYSGEYINALIGHKHSVETKKLMSQNGIKGKMAYTNGKETKFLYEPKNDFNQKGWDKQTCKKVSESVKNMIWIYNEKTGIQKRIKFDEHIPEGFIRYRIKKGKFKGGSQINDKYIKVLDLRDKKIKGILKENSEPDFQFFNISLKYDKIYILEYDNMYFCGFNAFKQYMKNRDLNLIWFSFSDFYKDYINNKIITVDEKNRSKSLNFRIKYNNIKCSDVIKLYKLSDFQFVRNKKLFNVYNKGEM